MKYPKYPAYKNSGVEWIGEIPATWSIKRLKYIIEKFTGGGTPSTGVSDYWTTEGGFPWVAISDITKTDVITETERKITVSGLNSKNLTLLPPGTIVYSMYASVGKVSKLLITASTNQAILGLINRENQLLNDYLKLSLEAFEPFVGLLFSSNTQNNINEEKVKNIIIPITYITDQAIIIRFLSTKNVLIDNLISKTQKMIELLKEKRQAIITNAVTKGIDPNVPMKNSGVEWIGGIPDHWDTIPIKFIMSCNDETLPESTHPETKIQYIEISDVSENQGITSIQEIKFSDAPSRARRIVKDGDIIISTVRTYLRAIATIKEPRENTVVSTGFAVLRSRGLSQKFAKYALSANYFIERIVSESTGVSYPAISSEKLMNFRIAIPDSKSQNYISDYIDKINGKLSQLISKQERMIELLKEYKTSLITQAVTGKIDVRGFAVPTDSNSA